MIEKETIKAALLASLTLHRDEHYNVIVSKAVRAVTKKVTPLWQAMLPT